MLRFLIKMFIVAGIVGFVGFGYLKYHQGNLTLGSVMDSVRSVDPVSLAGQVGRSLDSLVVNTGQSPVILGIQITEDSLETVADTLQGLPPDQLKVIKEYICQPASPSGGPASPSGG